MLPPFHREGTEAWRGLASGDPGQHPRALLGLGVVRTWLCTHWLHRLPCEPVSSAVWGRAVLLTWQVVVKEKRRESLGRASRCGKSTQPTCPGRLIVVTKSLFSQGPKSSPFPVVLLGAVEFEEGLLPGRFPRAGWVLPGLCSRVQPRRLPAHHSGSG